MGEPPLHSGMAISTMGKERVSGRDPTPMEEVVYSSIGEVVTGYMFQLGALSGDAGGDSESLIWWITGNGDARADEDKGEAESGVDSSEQGGFSRSAGGWGGDTAVVGDGDKGRGTR